MIYLKDYQAPEFSIRETHLNFDLHEDHARVRSRLVMERAVNATADRKILRLDGEGLTLKSVKLDGAELKAVTKLDQVKPGEYFVDATSLSIGVGELSQFEIAIDVVNEPQKNLACEGLYRSSGMFCTQCEAESFRKITYYVDRPDVMSIFEVTIEADKSKYPVLLSNGNKVAAKDVGGGRHQAVWKDPFKKPCYLFALVAGDLGCHRDVFKTKSGRKVDLEIYCKKGHEPRCEFAMGALKRSMKWDEDRYGLEYDLDIFMIVVADDFNMGAMENKGLNIFNAHYILADKATATDKDFNGVEAVVAHEYFHNWTGNRVTCRDWFQLSLKEGLTVYRDQEFSADMGSRAVKRIEDVVRLRTHQFAEDAGPMSHPVRPQSYVTIDNFYTMTVYEKGAEVIRMIETLIGREKFRKGMDKYFELFDGQAVTTDDFVHAMSLASGRDFTQFKNWYDQAGTPVVKVTRDWNQATGTLKLNFEQIVGAGKKPYLIPIAMGVLSSQGSDLGRELVPTRVLELTEAKQSFVIDGVKSQPALSLFRGFSAPVKVEAVQSSDELAVLVAHDTDPVAKWEAAQKLMLEVLLAKSKINVPASPEAEATERVLIESLGRVMRDEKLETAFVSFMLQLPSEAYVSQFLDVVDPEKVFEARENLMRKIATAHRSRFEEIEATLSRKPSNEMTDGDRSLRNTALIYLCLSDSNQDVDRALAQLKNAKDMTTEIGALEALNRTTSSARTTALQSFKEKWKHETLVMNKWLTLRAIAPRIETLKEVQELMKDPVFDKTNPNKIYSLLLAFAKFNPVAFHALSGSGYTFIADQVIDIDSRNPQIASRLVSAFNQWKTYEPRRREMLNKELRRIKNVPKLSSNVTEIVDRALAQ